MSVIAECQAGDEFYCLLEFVASPHGQGFSWDTCRTFHVGERLRYVTFFKYQAPNHDEDNADWMVVFEAEDGQRYAATQTYFVTAECWQGLGQFFAKSSAPQRDSTNKMKTARKASPKRASGQPKRQPASRLVKKTRKAS